MDQQEDPATRAEGPVTADSDVQSDVDDERADDRLDGEAQDATGEVREPALTRWHAVVGRSRERLQERYEVQRYSFVPETEVVAIDAHRHPLVNVLPALRTVAGLALLLMGPLLVPLVWFALVTAVWAQVRMSGGLRRSALIGAGAAGAFVVLHLLEGRRWDAVVLLLLLGWLVEDLADWHSDRLVVTDKRIYRRHGVFTKHSPSISLMAIAYIDAAVPPLGRLLHFGTLRLDSVAQRDAPLSRFDLIPDVVAVSHEILRLRAAAMPKGPPQVY